MAYRRRTILRRRPRRTRRMIMRRRPRRLLSTRALNVHHFKRTFTLGQIGANVANVFGGYTFNINQLPNATEFTNLFDMYRINKIVVRFVPSQNSSDVAPAGSSFIPNFHTVLDYNDATAPASLNEMYQYQNWRMSRGTGIHRRVFTPASIDYVNATAGANAGNPTWKQWISTSSPTIEHYALKYGVEAAAGVNEIVWTPYVTMYLSCKSVK